MNRFENEKFFKSMDYKCTNLKLILYLGIEIPITSSTIMADEMSFEDISNSPIVDDDGDQPGTTEMNDKNIRLNEPSPQFLRSDRRGEPPFLKSPDYRSKNDITTSGRKSLPKSHCKKSIQHQPFLLSRDPMVNNNGTNETDES